MGPRRWLGVGLLAALTVVGASCADGSSSSPPPSTAADAGSGATTTTAAPLGSTTTIAASVTTVDRTTFVSEGNAICARMTSAQAALAQDPASQGATPAAVANRLDGQATIVDAALQEMKGLAAPPGDEAALAEIYASVQQLVDLTRRSAAATARRDEGERAALLAQVDQAAQSADAASAAYGLSECAQG